ncbi:uncharacterized protein LOC109717071 isoform X2 [Ananas comosus]|uniref:Uncharacterized protein LOC109717071 isoform X2 n=1 Tax=Ananas comosus TaxID=4615 RepID=A0A6P5FQT4_ANACO|nr:uncharacterized protein LOC109717071 isoform X2 [Ananas comosus]
MHNSNGSSISYNHTNGWKSLSVACVLVCVEMRICCGFKDFYNSRNNIECSNSEAVDYSFSWASSSCKTYGGCQHKSNGFVPPEPPKRSPTIAAGEISGDHHGNRRGREPPRSFNGWCEQRPTQAHPLPHHASISSPLSATAHHEHGGGGGIGVCVAGPRWARLRVQALAPRGPWMIPPISGSIDTSLM